MRLSSRFYISEGIRELDDLDPGTHSSRDRHWLRERTQPLQQALVVRVVAEIARYRPTLYSASA
jgi:hypothetical protein